VAMTFSTGLRNAVLKTGSIKSVLETGTATAIKIFSGSPPADADAAETGTLLVTINSGGNGVTFADPGTGTTIQKTAAETWSGTVGTSGTASYFRMVRSGDTGASSSTQVRIQGNVGLAGADMNLSNTSLVATNTQVIDYFALAFPNAA
jgi:hypothetical protein